MNTSESISKIAAALLAAQKAITFAVKDSKNPHFKSTYADLGSVIEACKPALNGAGIAFMQMPAPSDPGTIALTTRLVHESGEWIESTATCPLPKNDPQGYGSANTYLRRYALAAAVGLYQDDDDGNAASKLRVPGQQRANLRSSGMTDEDGRKAIELLEPEQQEYLRDLGDALMTMVKETGNGIEAHKRIQLENLDNEQKLGLWSILDSKTRTAITKATQAAKEAATA